MDYFNAFLIVSKKTMSYLQRKLEKMFQPFVNLDDILAKISEKPASLNFQVTNICNANCIFCAYQYQERPKVTLPMDLFKKAMDEFDSFGGGGIGFTPLVGEPLIDPGFLEKISYARSKKNTRRIGFFTNGILINKVGSRAIIRSGVDEITVSIPGFDAQTYLRIFRADSWNDVYEGMLNLLKENELCHNKVDIRIGLRSDLALHQLLGIPAYQKLRRFRFRLEYNMCYDSWSTRIKQGDLKGIMRLRKPPKKREPCLLLYSGPTILSNGDMTLCGCRDLNAGAELVFGNIRDKTILDMWQDRRVENIRKGFYSSRYPKICRDCSFYSDLSLLRRQRLRHLLT